MNVGIDIGRKEVKIVRLEKAGKKFKLVDHGAREIMEGVKKYDPEQVKNAHIVAAISSLLDDMGVKPKRIKNLASSMSGRHINIKQIQTVEMPADELESSLQFEARKHIPLDGTDAVMDFQILGEDPKELDKINVLLIASTKKSLENHLDILEGTNIKPGVVDADPLALTNAFIAAQDMPDDGAIVLANVGALSTTLVVWGRQQQFFTREMNIGGHHFTTAIMDQVELSYNEAEKQKIDQGVSVLQSVDGDSGEEAYAIEVETRTIFDNFVEELRRSLRYYVKQTNQSFFHKVSLTGGSAPLPGLAEFVSDKLSVPVEIYNPMLQLQSDEVAAVQNPSKYSVAIGLAIRGNN
ncbi:MAG: Cell division protein FtsA [Candidatus Marinimicrobia bacterium]|nr:Cell division protein FtsA [Candidatus Neomarinimicrobiota bacterium]